MEYEYEIKRDDYNRITIEFTCDISSDNISYDLSSIVFINGRQITFPSTTYYTSESFIFSIIQIYLRLIIYDGLIVNVIWPKMIELLQKTMITIRNNDMNGKYYGYSDNLFLHHRGLVAMEMSNKWPDNIISYVYFLHIFHIYVTTFPVKIQNHLFIHPKLKDVYNNPENFDKHLSSTEKLFYYVNTNNVNKLIFLLRFLFMRIKK